MDSSAAHVSAKPLPSMPPSANAAGCPLEIMRRRISNALPAGRLRGILTGQGLCSEQVEWFVM